MEREVRRRASLRETLLKACLPASSRGGRSRIIKNKLLYDLVDYVVTMDKADKRYNNGKRIELGG